LIQLMKPVHLTVVIYWITLVAARVVAGGDLHTVEILKDKPAAFQQFENTSARFDGTNCIDIAHIADFDSNEITVEFWFQSTQPFDKKFWPASATLVSKATEGSGSGDWTIVGGGLTNGRNEGRILVGVGSKGDADIVLASEPGLNDGQFHHVAWTRTASGLNHLLVDGIVHASAQDKGGSITNNRPIQIGGERFLSGGSFLKGQIAAVAVYSHALPTERVRAHIAAGEVAPQMEVDVDPRIAETKDHWSFRPLERPTLPKSQTKTWITSPIDAFILEKLEAAKLPPTTVATKHALLRRVSFDLTGLPPTVAEIDSFTTDTRPEAFAELVDRLLASPAYGERWARHWLDVVRFADSGGYETDILYEQAWRYRDYVIRSFNEDKPYDQFLMEQVAGDEIWPENNEAMQDAVAVWTLGQWPNAFDDFPEKLAYVRRNDQVVTFCESMLGLSVGCANCHQHKYDPISQRDYFGLEAIFSATETWDKNRNRKAWNKGETSSYRILRHPPTPALVRFLKRGELSEPHGLVPPALPAFLPGGGRLPDGPDENKQRRAHLARWLVSEQNPLTARVIANRIWQWHFGRALAATPNDLGTNGSPPSHPDLLDWLASELIGNGWSLKQLHRVVLLSATYQQSALRDTEAMAADPQNILLAGFPRRRLEAEEIWDHLHATAGTLDRKSFGKPFVPKLSPEEMAGIYEIGGKADTKWPVTEEQNRRAIYILNRRSFRFPFFEAFDPASNGASFPVRQSTTVPAQALTLLNNRTVNNQAAAMATRLASEAGGNPEKQVRFAWLLAYSREVNPAELDFALRFLTESKDSNTALIEFCLGLINTTEFIHAN
jgi:hypothetical protein